MSIIEIEELKFERESELESVLSKNPDLIEKGLRILDTQVIVRSGRLDILGLDSGGVLVVIELKIVESDEMLWQALDYYDWVFRNIDSIKRMYRGHEIDYKQIPRLILIAPSFTEITKKRAVYLEPTVELLEYKYLQAGDQKGLLFVPISLPSAPGDERIETPRTIKELIDYINNESMKKLCKEVIERIKSIGANIQVSSGKYHIAFFIKGARFAALYPKREYFGIDTYINDEWKYTKIESDKDFDDIFDNIKLSFQKLGGILVDSDSDKTPSKIEEDETENNSL